jgi:dCTP deaminase
MPLTGPEIAQQHGRERITIDPFLPTQLGPNSYAVRLAATGMVYAETLLDARVKPTPRPFAFPASGVCLQPGVIYLAQTMETIGSPAFAMTLDALTSVSALGIWIQFSAPLGHVGAIIPWTLELAVAHPVIVYAGMPIGKVAFWPPLGPLVSYRGRYAGSQGVVASKLVEG